MTKAMRLRCVRCDKPQELHHDHDHGNAVFLEGVCVFGDCGEYEGPTGPLCTRCAVRARGVGLSCSRCRRARAVYSTTTSASTSTLVWRARMI